MVDVENSSFGYDFIFEKMISEGPGIVTGGPSDFQIKSPGGEYFAPPGVDTVRICVENHCNRCREF